MFAFLNQYSFVIAFVIFFIALAAFLPVKRWRMRLPIYVGAVVLALAIYIFLRPGDSSVSTAAEADQVLTSGEPVFVEFFSNTCAACLASKPFVDGLKSDLADDVVFMQLNVQDGVLTIQGEKKESHGGKWAKLQENKYGYFSRSL